MQAMSRTFLSLGAAALLLAIALGAYGTHALAAQLPPAVFNAYGAAVDYQFYHGLGLVAVAILCELSPASALFRLSGWLLLAGIVLFCGSIYATTLGAPSGVGRAAPIGGIAFMAAWLALASGAWRARHRRAADTLA